MAHPMPIPPKPPWHSPPTAFVFLPTAVPDCNSLIESPTDTPHNIENKIKNNNNDRPDDHDDDDVDCFPRQDKQPVLPQNISPNANANSTSPSLIESTTDTPTAPMNPNNNNNNDRPDDDNNNDVDCFPRQDKQPVLPQDISTNTHTALPSLIESATNTRKNKSYDNIENNNDRPDDDNDNDNDVDCFPRQDKQPVLPQDILPTAPTANANNTPPSLIAVSYTHLTLPTSAIV